MPSARKTYRHGNVRAAAIDAGFDLLCKHGAGSLSLRAVAAQIGVAHRSLYSAFKDREDLLDAIAARAFDALCEALKPARSAGDFVERYCRFALRQGALYDVMMSRRHGDMKQAPELQQAAHRVIAQAFNFFAEPRHSAAENRRAVMRMTMFLHGALTLYRMGVLDLVNDKAFFDELRQMLAGLSRDPSGDEASLVGPRSTSKHDL